MTEESAELDRKALQKYKEINANLYQSAEKMSFILIMTFFLKHNNYHIMRKIYLLGRTDYLLGRKCKQIHLRFAIMNTLRNREKM